MAKVFRQWLALSLYFMLSWINGATWSTYSAILSSAADYYSVGESEIIWFEMCFFVSYFITAPIAPFALQKNAALTFQVMSIITAIGLWVRFLAMDLYILALIGQIITASLTGIILPAVPTVPKQWFKPENEMIPLVLATMSNFLGIGSGFLISALIQDIFTICLLQACIGVIPVAMAPFCKPDPDIVPESSNFKAELRLFKKDKVLIAISVVIAIAISILFSFLGLLEEILETSVVLSGVIGFVLVIAGMLGSIFATILITKQFKLTYIVIGLLIISVLTMIFWPIMGYFPIGHIFFGALYGFTLLSVVPMGLEIALKITEISESFVSSVIFVQTQIMSLIISYILEYFQKYTGVTALWLVLVFTLIFAIPFVVLIIYISKKGEATEKKAISLEEKLNSSEIESSQ